MRNNLYYREIADRMSNRLLENPDQQDELDEIIAREYGDESSVYTICAKAACVFDAVEEISQDDLIDWDHALDEYADEVIDQIMAGDRLDTLDMISLATASGQSIR
jgi:hypothetical protein